jgi:carboxypeptidase Taq
METLMAGASEALRERMATIQDLDTVSSLLSWDQLTMMPAHGAQERGEQIRTVEMIGHAMLVDDETGRLLDRLESENGASEPDEVLAALVRVTQYDRERALRVPPDLVGEIAQAAADGYGAWTEARARSDFASFLPALERNLELKFRYIDCFEPEESPYDVLIEDYEQELKSAQIAGIFEALKPWLQELLKLVVANAGAIDDAVFRQPFPVEDQRAAGLRVLHLLGYDESSWRLDPTVHPFASAIGLSDIRLTTRYKEDDLTDSLMSTIHEFGHGLYEAQIDPKLGRTPMATGCSMILHESQSRFWENMVGNRCPVRQGGRASRRALVSGVDRLFPDLSPGLGAFGANLGANGAGNS